MEDIIIRNSNMVYRLAMSQMKNKFDADDVYQDVFIRYLKRKPSFISLEHEKAWFIRVTLNCCKTSLKSFWFTKIEELNENISLDGISKFDLSEGLKKLPKKYNAILHLYYYEGLSVKEISNILKIKEGYVRMLLTRARRMLKRIIEEDNK